MRSSFGIDNRRSSRERRVDLLLLLRRIEAAHGLAEDTEVGSALDGESHVGRPVPAARQGVVPSRHRSAGNLPIMLPTIVGADISAYCRTRGWSIVGYDLALLAFDDTTVRVAVLALDESHHFLAVSAAAIEGEQGIGIIDLQTAEARFVRLAAPGAGLRN